MKKDDDAWIVQVCTTDGVPARAYRVVVSPQIARRFLSSMVHNRPAKPSRVARYREQIRKGEWVFTGQGFVFNAEGKMIDGQHRCMAIIAEGIEVEVLIVLGVEAEAFNHLDQGSARTGGDFIDVLNRTTVASALNFLWQEENGKLGLRQAMPADMASAMLAKHPKILDAVAATHTKATRQVFPPSIAAYAFYRMSVRSLPKAESFFYGLTTGEGLMAGDPRLVLRQRLTANYTAKAKLPREDVVALVIKAWIPYLEGRTLGVLRYNGKALLNSEGDVIRPEEPFPKWP